uniref:Uncharacterized protein n=1 Tax=Opuntia streptacantha TaxID=393608 RepID=A0A7C9E8N2_OPUST
MIAVAQWHHEGYKASNKSFPAPSTRDCFNTTRSSDNSDDVSRIKFRAWIMMDAKSRSVSLSRIVESSRYTLSGPKRTQSRRIIKAPRFSRRELSLRKFSTK